MNTGNENTGGGTGEPEPEPGAKGGPRPGIAGILGAWLRRLTSKPGDYSRRYGKRGGSNSVDYRRNRRRLHQGRVPEKFTRLAEIMPGNSVVDVGAGEGILGLVLAATKSRVRTIDLTPRRHASGMALRQDWRKLGRRVENCEMVLGDALSRPDLLDGFDTLVASRVVYYFGPRLDPFMAEAARRVKYVCLIGNPSRNRRYAKHGPPADIGEDVFYSTPQGMQELLHRHGFEIVHSDTISDPVVIGRNTRQVPDTGKA